MSDWSTLKLGDLGETIIGLTYSPSQIRADGTLVLRSSNIQNGLLDLKDTVRVNAPIPEKLRVGPSDVLICVRNGSRPLIGKSLYLDERVAGETFGAFMALFRSPLNYYRRFFFESNAFKRQVEEHLGATINQITNKSLKGFEVTYPNDADERARISEYLVDANDLIASLGQLIAKKRAIKQGMMQELLSGRTRLPGFTGEWTTTRLSRVLRFQPGFPFSSQYFTEKPVGPRLVRNRDLRAEDAIVYYTGPVPIDFVLARGDVLIGMDGDFEPMVWFQPGALLNQRVGRLRLTSSIDGAFLSHALVGPLKVLQGETGATTVKHLSHSDVEQLELLLPPVAEQRAIARALDDAGRLIVSLERRLETTRAIKQGMMQELLTGRTRLPVEEAVA